MLSCDPDKRPNIDELWNTCNFSEKFKDLNGNSMKENPFSFDNKYKLLKTIKMPKNNNWEVIQSPLFINLSRILPKSYPNLNMTPKGAKVGYNPVNSLK